MSENEAMDFPIWRTPGGEPVSCVEKIRVRQVWAELVGSIVNPYRK